jgi:hypothetical protein
MESATHQVMTNTREKKKKQTFAYSAAVLRIRISSSVKLEPGREKSED